MLQVLGRRPLVSERTILEYLDERECENEDEVDCYWVRECENEKDGVEYVLEREGIWECRWSEMWVSERESENEKGGVDYLSERECENEKGEVGKNEGMDMSK